MKKFAVFRIADETFGIAIERVVEIIRVMKVFSLPGLPSFLSGVMSVRGAVVPLIDLRKRFGKSSTGRKERIIIVRFEREKVGLLVDEVKEIMALSAEEITNPPALFRGFRTEYVTGLGKKNDGIIILLNLDALLTSEELIQMKESMEMIEADSAGVNTETQR